MLWHANSAAVCCPPLSGCTAQVRKIAWMRLRMAVTPAPTGFLTCHVLDTARG
eukprot:COSAG01_NODE_31725_length_592_cov_1.456389_1_plen_52_part_10